MEIKKSRAWSAMDVRSMCIRENFYTCGDCTAYMKMLDYVEEHKKDPEDMDIYLVANDILNHTSRELEQTVENIMFLLANDVIRYFYTVEYSESEQIIARVEAEERAERR